MNKAVTTEELFSDFPTYLEELFRSSIYPWEILPKIEKSIKEIAERYGFSDLREPLPLPRELRLRQPPQYRF